MCLYVATPPVEPTRCVWTRSRRRDLIASASQAMRATRPPSTTAQVGGQGTQGPQPDHTITVGIYWDHTPGVLTLSQVSNRLKIGHPYMKSTGSWPSNERKNLMVWHSTRLAAPKIVAGWHSHKAFLWHWLETIRTILSWKMDIYANVYFDLFLLHVWR